YCDVRLNQLLRVYIDGVPLDLASRLLPAKTKLNFGLLSHIHLHAGAQKRYADQAVAPRKGSLRVNQQAMIGLIESLEGTVRKLSWQPAGTEWGAYYEATNYSDSAFEHKKQLVRQWTAEQKPALIWDLGGNTGVFSREAAAFGAFTVSFDIDPAAVEQNYQVVKKNKEQNILPLVLDLTNPSPAIGWDNQERDSFGSRGPVDMVLALAVIHHLAISNNLPLPQIADFFASLCRTLAIEFVPKSDSQVQKLLSSRQDIFPDYTREGFESVFAERFIIHKIEPVRDSERTLYLMRKR
ncbi:MAG: class I SAM-dependent methyltransferase, partial [Anaerolineales bacterium]|nr:class I SAM-dependent methyltransferase [Anaerolineales bacterium]